MSIPLDCEFSVKWVGQTAEGGLQLLPSTFNLQLQVSRALRYLRLGGMSVITFVACPSTQLYHLQMENCGWTSSYSQHLSQQEPKFSNRWGKHVSPAQPNTDLPGFHFESKATLETALLMRWLVRCPWSLPVLIHQQWICLVRSCWNSCPTLVLTGWLGSFISLKSLLLIFQFLWKSEGLAGTSL